ncbi:MAG: Rne/Rng family ribonuclease [Abditibacteriota bacterium]|nr:Rne/Rng family ribonuclease [Abditibacteriota bacterium]
MSKEILVNVESRETRVAVIEDGKLAEVYVEREERVVGSIYKCRVSNVLAGMDAAFVDIGLEKNAFLYVADALPEVSEISHSHRQPNVRIKDVLKVGQELLVQVMKGPRGTKGARVSARISLPGRFLVLMPDADNVGVSRKIESEAERHRLKKAADELKPKGFGLIVRTEGEGASEAELREDLKFLLRMWNRVLEKAADVPAPALVHQDLSLIYKTIRDVFSADISKMTIDSPVDYEKAIEILELSSPRLRSKLRLYDEPTPIFDRYGIEDELDNLLRRKVWLKSGGHLAIDQTEALTTFDVNTGKFIGSTSLSDTILRTNLESVSEIARQLRLRDIGGIIVIDFIDMLTLGDRKKVVAALEKELGKDRTRTKISHISPLGLVEMTRKRTGETLTEFATEPCPHCHGIGRVPTAETISLKAERYLRKAIAETNGEAYYILANPDVAIRLIGTEGAVVEEMERRFKRALYIRSNALFDPEYFDIQPGNMVEMDREMIPVKEGDAVECEIIQNPFTELPRASAWYEGFLIEIPNGGTKIGQRETVKIEKVSRSFAFGSV